ncbi:hypothetical protein FRACA_480022 [Frankia canadensis]|uniref:Uncharacterized protein n=1 Tax=Frankia canadensis TaxID=1836972 RepID=A0A2I2KXZ6_9ACTN|nr:hypothetical protein FRACA_480022 [Frankia canadensis]SOU57823.1 hypothetical protein FRACA_480022 [Frankia canadensis]
MAVDVDNRLPPRSGTTVIVVTAFAQPGVWKASKASASVMPTGRGTRACQNWPMMPAAMPSASAHRGRNPRLANVSSMGRAPSPCATRDGRAPGAAVDARPPTLLGSVRTAMSSRPSRSSSSVSSSIARRTSSGGASTHRVYRLRNGASAQRFARARDPAREPGAVELCVVEADGVCGVGVVAMGAPGGDLAFHTVPYGDDRTVAYGHGRRPVLRDRGSAGAGCPRHGRPAAPAVTGGLDHGGAGGHRGRRAGRRRG